MKTKMTPEIATKIRRKAVKDVQTVLKPIRKQLNAVVKQTNAAWWSIQSCLDKDSNDPHWKTQKEANNILALLEEIEELVRHIL